MHSARKIPASREETVGEDTKGDAGFGIGTCRRTARF